LLPPAWSAAPQPNIRLIDPVFADGPHQLGKPSALGDHQNRNIDNDRPEKILEALPWMADSLAVVFAPGCSASHWLNDLAPNVVKRVDRFFSACK